jgi:DNA-binding IclR family transcriptional regulator
MISTRLLKTLQLGLRILELLAAHPDGLSNSEIASAMAMDPARSYRFLATLLHEGCIHKQDNKYGASCWAVRFVDASRISLRDVGNPLIARLAYDTNATASLSVIEGLKAVPIAIASGPQPLRVSSNLGHLVQLHSSALGKALLAFQSELSRKAFIPSLDLVQFTPRTICSVEALRAELEGIRQKGYAVDDEEMYEGVTCVAVPVLNRNSEAVASVSCAFPKVQGGISPEQVSSVVRQERAVVRELVNLLSL